MAKVLEKIENVRRLKPKCLYGLLSTTRFRRGSGAFLLEIPSKVWKGPPASNEICQARFLSRKLLAERSNVPRILRSAHA